MAGLNLLPIFMVGLFGSVHCVGMCGGVVGAISLAPRRAFPVPVLSLTATPTFAPLARVLSYNAGRIGSYAMAGALAGGLAGGARGLAGLPAVQGGAYWLANLMLVAMGLYLTGAWRGLAQIERLGQGLWRRLQPLQRRMLPLDSPLKLLAIGALWGWLPCGMVYSVLVTAMFSGSAAGGAEVMLAFGAGTLPALFALGLVGAGLTSQLQRRPVRVACGVLVAGFGMLGLVRAAYGMPASWLGAVCTSVLGS